MAPGSPGWSGTISREECADHEDFAVGEVDELDDPVDHRVAQRDQGVDAADRQRIEELLGERRDQLLVTSSSLSRTFERGLDTRQPGSSGWTPRLSAGLA